MAEANHERKVERKPYFTGSFPSRIDIDSRTLLRFTTPKDAPEMFRATDASRQEIGKWLPWVKSNTKESDTLSFIQASRAERESKEAIQYAIFYDDQFAGHIGIMARENNTGEIGYWLATSFYGKGLATRAAEALTQLGLGELNCDRVIICAEVDNVSSWSIAQRLKYQRAGEFNDGDKKLYKYEKKR